MYPLSVATFTSQIKRITLKLRRISSVDALGQRLCVILTPLSEDVSNIFIVSF